VKKRMLFATTLTFCFGLALMPYSAFAGASDSAKTAVPETTGKSACPSMKSGGVPKCAMDGKMSGDAAKGGGCPFGKMTEAKATSADAKCDYQGKCADLTLAIKGMTCTGCEQTITEALKSDKGVIKVVSIDYKTGKAVVCYDPAKVEQGKLAALVTNTGYQAEIVPASATLTAVTGKGACCSVSTGKCEKKADPKTDDKDGSH